MAKKTVNLTGIEALIGISFIIGLIWAMAEWTDRTLEYWLGIFKGQPVEVPLWMDLLLNLLVPPLALLGNLISEILRLVM